MFEDIVNFEEQIHKTNEHHRYSPNIKFGGSVRGCFTKNGLKGTIKMFNEFKENMYAESS